MTDSIDETFKALIRTPANEMISLYVDFHKKCSLHGIQFEEARDAFFKKHGWTFKEYRSELFKN